MWDKVVKHGTRYVIIGPYIRCGSCVLSVLCRIKSTQFAFVFYIASLYQVEGAYWALKLSDSREKC